jgi:hypothetical protein
LKRNGDDNFASSGVVVNIAKNDSISLYLRLKRPPIRSGQLLNKIGFVVSLCQQRCEPTAFDDVVLPRLDESGLKFVSQLCCSEPIVDRKIGFEIPYI